MPLCYNCLQVVQKREASMLISNRLPTVYHYDTFDQLQYSSGNCELCKAIIRSMEREGYPRDNLEDAFRGLKLRIEVDNYRRANAFPPSSSDIRQRGLRAYWVREEFSTHLVLCTDLGHIQHRPIWMSSEPATVDKIMPTILQWLKECDSSHTECCLPQLESEPPVLPSRVIDVGESDGSREPYLYISKGSCGRYTTLSHCWGKHLPLKTTKSTLKTRIDAIPIETLPKTYRDAINITRNLGIRYVWIDSLCIVQDDTSDWEIESARMASIYQNSYLNIAATTASDSDGGCIYTPEHSTSLQYHPRRDRYPFVGQDPVSQTAYVRFRPALEKLEASPLNKRAWVLQEVFLSRRTIHFTEEQLYWFCAHRRASEDGTTASLPFEVSGTVQLGPPRFHPYQEANINRGHAYTLWWSLIEDYTSRTLTNSNDKLAALAGLTTLFQKKLSDEPLAGMWKAELGNSICWKCDPSTVRSDTPFPGIPSFSWASIDGPIKRNCCVLPTEQPQERGDRDVDILHAYINWSGQELTSRITGGRLVVRGLLTKLSFSSIERQPNSKASSRLALIRGGSHVGQVTFDRHSIASEGVVWCLAVKFKAVTLNLSWSEAIYRWFHVLILEPTGEKNEFRRIGVGKVWDDNSGVFDNVDRQTLSIV